jgi:hypothetical protein
MGLDRGLVRQALSKSEGSLLLSPAFLLRYRFSTVVERVYSELESSPEVGKQRRQMMGKEKFV